MHKLHNEIEQRMDMLKDEVLIDIVNKDFKDYVPEAIEIAKKILEKRGVDHTAIEDKEASESSVVEQEEISIPIYQELQDSAGGYETLEYYKKKYKEKADGEDQTIRPWIRYWARVIDVSLISIIIRLLIKNISIDVHETLMSIPFGLAYNTLTFIILIIVESLLISIFGYTIGKYILSVRIRDNKGNKLSLVKSFKRVFLVWVLGEGLNIIYLSFLTQIISYFRLKKYNSTKWDEILDTRVSHGNIGILRGFIAFALIFIITFLYKKYLM